MRSSITNEQLEFQIKNERNSIDGLIFNLGTFDGYTQASISTPSISRALSARGRIVQFSTFNKVKPGKIALKLEESNESSLILLLHDPGQS